MLENKDHAGAKNVNSFSHFPDSPPKSIVLVISVRADRTRRVLSAIQSIQNELRLMPILLHLILRMFLFRILDPGVTDGGKTTNCLINQA
jgi:hypothetical protein